MSRASSQQIIRSAAFFVERLEQRCLLSAALKALIPTLYTGAADQTPLASTITQLQHTFPGNVSGEYYKIATDDAADGAITSIYIASRNFSSLDAAIALFDSDGNRLKLADLDATAGQPGIERLDAVLQPKTPYIVGVYSNLSNLVDISISLPQQVTNTPLKLDPQTTSTSLDANSGEDTYNAPADPDYYPLDFFNGRANGVVSVSPLAAGVQSTIGVLQEVPQVGQLANIVPGTTGFASVGTGSGASPTVSVTPSAGQNLADGNYQLSVAPLDFTSPARAYHIDASADALAAVAVDAAVPVPLGTPLPTSLGVASISHLHVMSSGNVYSFIAAQTGPAAFEVQSPTVGSTLALYDATGQTLLAAHGRTTASGFSFSYNVTAGTSYRLAPLPAVGAAGLATFVIRQNYSAAPLSLVAGPIVQPGVVVGGASGPKFFHLDLPIGADVLSVRLVSPDGSSGNIALTYIGTGSPLSRTASAGQTINFVVDIRAAGRSIDIAFTADNSAALDFSIAAINVPATLPASTPTATVDLHSGDVSGSADISAPGQAAGVQFWALNPGTNSVVTATSTADSLAVLARYEQQDGALKLVDFAIPSDAGFAILNPTINSGRLAAIAAVAVRPDGGAGTVALHVDGPAPTGVGVAMAPEPVPQLGPNDPPATPPYSANLRIRGVKLTTAKQRDLWETVVPINVSGVPKLTIKPVNAGGALALSVLVLDQNNNTLETITTTPGQQINLQPLASVTAASIAGQKLRFLVEPIGTNLGDGLYTLELKLDSSDPTPFQVIEPKFQIAHSSTLASLPANEPIPDITVSRTGDGNFTSSLPYNSGANGNTGSIDVYKFVHGATPFSVWTQDLDPSVNTNIRLYEAKPSAIPTELDAIPGFGVNFDYFPADRSMIDARIDVWNTDAEKTAFSGAVANTWYVVVKNEQGSLGHYRLHVDDLAPTQTGPGTTAPYYGYGFTNLDIDPKTGTGASNFLDSNDIRRLIMPSTVLGNTTITISPNAVGIRVFQLDVLDSLGNVQSTFSGSSATSVTFNVSGLGSFGEYFLRPSITFGSQTTMNVSLSVPLGSASDALKPANHSSLTNPSSYMVPAETYARADQFADGTFSSRRDSPIPTGTGLKHKVVFWVDQPGFATFTVTGSGTSRVVGLWRGTRVLEEADFRIAGTLEDYSSAVLPDNSIILQAYVLPGMYFITVDGNTTTSRSIVTVNGQLPQPFSTPITLDPNSGSTSAVNLNVVDPVLPPSYPLEDNGLLDFRTTFYKVITPGGVKPSGLAAHVAAFAPPPGSNLWEGRAEVSITRLAGTTATYTNGDPDINLDDATDDLVADVAATDVPLPGNEYYIGVNRDRMVPGDKDLDVSASFSVPQSGTPDIVVDGVRLDPANGRTKVTVNLRNNGYASTDAFVSKLRFSNYPADSVFTVPGMGAFASLSYSWFWDPTNGTDTATFTADTTNLIEERSESNNSATATLNKSRPTIAVALADPLMDGDADPNVWGRYVSGVAGPTSNINITTTDADGAADVYQTYFKVPTSSSFNAFNGAGPFTWANFDFSKLAPTSATNLNRFGAYVKDQWGLTSDIRYISANVVPESNFFTSETFDPSAHTYKLEFGYSLVNFDKSLSELLGFDLPVVGDKRTKLILNFGAFGTATLNTAQSLSLPLGGELNVTAVDYEIYKIDLGGGIKISDNIMAGATLEVSGKTLDVTAVAVSVQLRDLKLLDLDTGKIRLFSFGIPKIASLNAFFRFALKADLSAGIKVGLDTQSSPVRAGILSPTFVEPKITGEADISGDVEVLGFDAADLEGHVGLGLSVTVGLDNNDTSKLFTFDDFIDHIKYNITGELNYGLSAHVWGLGKVWSWEPDPITFPVASNTVEGIITNDPALPDPYSPIVAGALPEAPADSPLSPDQMEPTVKAGSDPVGPYDVEAAPQLVINPNGGRAVSVQVVDGDPDPNQTRGQLMFSTRDASGAPWSDLAPLPSSADVADPVLVRMNDAADSPFMLVYQAIDLPGASADQTLSDRLAARDLRYRIWDGAAWSDESVLAGDPGGDSDHSIAFAPNGAGVAAWVHNSAAVPMGEDGEYARDQQEIYVAKWDDATQSWLPGEALTADAQADSQPAVFAENDKMYVAWIHETATGNELMFSTNDGSGWTTPAALPITGLAPGGQFMSVALGSQAPGQIDVLFNYRVPNADGSLDSKLYDRASDSASFGAPATIEIVAQDGNYSHIRATNLPDGSLVASWKDGDGVINDIFAATLSPSGASAWSKPIQLTQGTTIEQRPSVAVEPDGQFQVLYEIAQPGTGDAPAVDAPPIVSGVGATTAAALPEIGFTKHLDFNEENLAISGATATGSATIINRGLATTDVTIDYLSGPVDAPTVLSTRTVRLSPGATFDASFDYPIVAGEEVYSVRLTTADVELVGADDNISSYTLNGLPDLQLVSLQLLNPNSPPSASNPLQARVRNLSDQPIDAFSVDFRSGDEQYPQNPWSSIATIAVPSLAAGADDVVSTVLSVPALSGVYVFSAVADSDDDIVEANEGNNNLNMQISRQADPGLQTSGFPPQIISATLLNSSGVNNVLVGVELYNFASGSLGSITSGPVTVRLLRSIDDSDFIEIASQSFASVAPAGFGTQVTFTTSGLAGDNRFRVVVDPASPVDDSNAFNNIAEARLQIRGLPDLSPQNVSLDVSSVSPGGPVTLSVDVSNTGIAKASNVLVEVIGHLAPDDGGVVFGSVVLDQVDPLSLQTVHIPLDTTGLAGSYDLTVVVNRTLEVLETTDANNTSDPVQLTVVGTAPPALLSSQYEVDVPSFVMNFDQPIIGLDASDVQLLSLTTGLPIASSSLQLTMSADGMQATITYLDDPEGVLPDGWYSISISQNSFTNADGIGNASLTTGNFFVLNADANRDGEVDTLDFVILATNFNNVGATFSEGDFNYDGKVNALDFNAIATGFGTTLPTPTLPLSAAPRPTRPVVSANLFGSVPLDAFQEGDHLFSDLLA